MTRDEAITAFHEALLTAVNGSQQVQSATRRMQSMGINIEKFEIDVVLSAACAECAPAAPQQADADFLRSLRIDPDLQFQAGAGGSTS